MIKSDRTHSFLLLRMQFAETVEYVDRVRLIWLRKLTVRE